MFPARLQLRATECSRTAGSQQAQRVPIKTPGHTAPLLRESNGRRHCFHCSELGRSYQWDKRLQTESTSTGLWWELVMVIVQRRRPWSRSFLHIGSRTMVQGGGELGLWAGCEQGDDERFHSTRLEEFYPSKLWVCYLWRSPQSLRGLSVLA